MSEEKWVLIGLLLSVGVSTCTWALVIKVNAVLSTVLHLVAKCEMELKVIRLALEAGPGAGGGEEEGVRGCCR